MEEDNHGILFDELQEDNFLEETNYESNMDVEESLGENDGVNFSDVRERIVNNSTC